MLYDAKQKYLSSRTRALEREFLRTVQGAKNSLRRRRDTIAAFAISGAQRAQLLRDVPTYREVGYNELVVEDGLGLYVPAKTPADVVAKLNAATLEALEAKDLQDAIRNYGFDVSGEGPREFTARLEEERKRWAAIGRATGFEAME